MLSADIRSVSSHIRNNQTHHKKRWQIEILFKRVKQNFPLKYFLATMKMSLKYRYGVLLSQICSSSLFRCNLSENGPSQI